MTKSRLSIIITFIATLLATLVSVTPATAQPGPETTTIRSSVTYVVTNVYEITSKGSTEPKTDMAVVYANGEAAGLYAEIRKGLTAYDAEFADYKDLRSRLVKAGTESKPIRVVSYRGQNLTNGHDLVSDFSFETAMGHEALGGLRWTNVSQPAADYSAGIAPKGIRLRVTAKTTCTVSYPLDRTEVCVKRTEIVTVKNIGTRKAKLAFESKIGQAWVEEGSPTAELPTLKKSLKPGKTWNIEFMNYYGGGDFHYQGESYPMYDDSSFTLFAGKSSTVLHKYGYGASNASPWWWGVYTNEMEENL